MTQEDERPHDCKVTAFHHVTFRVSNAKQASEWYCIHYGFGPYALKMTKDAVFYAIRLCDIILVFQSFLNADSKDMTTLLQGDAVEDVAFQVDDLDYVVSKAKENGAKITRDIWIEPDECGHVRYCVIHAFGNVTHTLVERRHYSGSFLPAYRILPDITLPILELLPTTHLTHIDHAVGVQHLYDMSNVVRWYEQILSLHRFWSIDDRQVHTEYSGLSVTVVANDADTVKIAIGEPGFGAKRAKSQIQEYLDYNGGPGIQHIAFHTDDIVASVEALRLRGAEFIRAPKTYFDQLRQRLRTASVRVDEDLDTLERLGILLDYDENGYLLQIFTKPVQDRPTLFLEIIQRHNHRGFGAGNIKALFEAVEIEQHQRGNLLDSRNDGHA